MFTTNEAGEIILAEETPKKTRKKRETKEKEPQFLPPFFSKDYFKFYIGPFGYMEGGDSNQRHLILKWKREDYLPLYSIKFWPSPGKVGIYDLNNISQYRNTDPVELNKEKIKDVIKIRPMFKQMANIEGMLDKYWKMWDQENYHLLSYIEELWFNKTKIDSPTLTEIKDQLQSRIQGIIDSEPDLTINIATNTHTTGAARIVEKFKYQSRWRWTTVRTRDSSVHPMYLTKYNFLARQVQWRNDSSNTPIGFWPIKPLAITVVKKENYQLYKTLLMANEPIPASIVELWIDRDIDTEGTDPFKTTFVRQIKNPMKKQGIEVKVFDSLSDELFNRPSLPKFRSFMDQQNYIENILEEFNKEEKIKLKIS